MKSMRPSTNLSPMTGRTTCPSRRFSVEGQLEVAQGGSCASEQEADKKEYLDRKERAVDLQKYLRAGLVSNHRLVCLPGRGTHLPWSRHAHWPRHALLLAHAPAVDLQKYFGAAEIGSTQSHIVRIQLVISVVRSSRRRGCGVAKVYPPSK